MSAPTNSITVSLALLRRHLPGFSRLRRAASWPDPLGRMLVRRRLDDGSDAAAAAAALRLVERDDRSFCRAVHLEGWPDVARETRAVFRLVDDGGLLWPVALRAMVLFAGAETGPKAPRRLELPTADGAGSPDDGSDPRHFTIRTVASEDAGFRVVVGRYDANHATR